MPDTPLFDPPAPVVRERRQYRDGDRVLYQPPRRTGRGYNRADNLRVRALLQAHLEEKLVADPVYMRTGNQPAAWGRARGALARDWVALCRHEGMALQLPGKPRKVHHAKADPHEDAARTALRQFMEGTDMPDWVLVGIEATICDRRGMALPRGAYMRQGRIL